MCQHRCGQLRWADHVEVAHRLARNEPISEIRDLRGTAYACKKLPDDLAVIDASDAEIGTALSVGANPIVGTTGLIDYTNFDVAADGLITTLAGIEPFTYTNRLVW